VCKGLVARLISERATTRGRSATEDGDGRARVKSALSRERQLANRIEQRNTDPFGGHAAD
jgi:hypothetical protein